MFILTFR